MTEQVLDAVSASGLSGTVDPGTDFAYPNLGQNGWGPDRHRSDARLLDMARLSDQLRVYAVDTNADAVGVRAGRVFDGSSSIVFSGADPAVDNLANNDVTYVWLESDGAGGLRVSSAIDATGWPATQHIKLAQVTMAAGVVSQVLDRRGEHLYSLGTDSQAMAVYGPWKIDGDGAYLNGGGVAGGGATLTPAAAGLAQVWDDSALEFQTLDLSSTGAGYTSNHQLLPDTPAINDAVYLGHTVAFAEIALDVLTPGAYTADALAYEYWDGTAWVALTLVQDRTDTTAGNGLRSLQSSGAIHFMPPSDWATTTVNNQLAYWIRVRVTAAVITTAPALNAKVHELVTPAAAYTSPVSRIVTGLRVSDGTTGTLHGANAVTFIFINFTTGKHSGLLTWPVSQRALKVTGLAITINTGDVLGVVIMQEDTTNEVTNAVLELTTQKVR